MLDNLLVRTRDGHRQSDKHWNCFKGTVGETAERTDRQNSGILKHQ